jgi:ABC-type dipeptide/oligopeptide/nickel transport system ATPase subunit
MKTSLRLGGIAVLIVAVWIVMVRRESRQSLPSHTGPFWADTPAAVSAPAPDGSRPTKPTHLPRLVDLGAKKCIPCKLMAPISPRIQERLADVLVDQGDAVSAGQLLARLEDGELKRQVEVAEAALARAKATGERVRVEEARAQAVEHQARQDHKRISDLITTKVSSQAELDKAIEQLRMAESDLQRAAGSASGIPAPRYAARRTAARKRAMELLDYLGVADRAGNLPEALSGGQQQRVAVARPLANEPNLVLADEPTAALDSHRGRQVMELFRKVAHERGAAVIVVTHDHRALDVFDRHLEMEDGELKPEPKEKR